MLLRQPGVIGQNGRRLVGPPKGAHRRPISVEAGRLFNAERRGALDETHAW